MPSVTKTDESYAHCCGASTDAATRCDLPGLGVRFVEPVNVYQRAERAMKYGLLFIGLTFGGFFLFETLKRWRMHPLQYAFVGLALALGSLLLFALLAAAMWLTRRVDWYTAHATQQ